VVSGRVAHVGTFNANPLCAAAALAVITTLERHADRIYPQLEQAAATLASILEEEAAAAGVPIRVRHETGVAHAFLTDEALQPSSAPAAPDHEGYRRFAGALLAEGVHVIPRGLLYVSTEHTEAELDETRAAVARAARRFAGEEVVAT
jgi:glutamate-1-semialdehyde 2,1-aminomutase